jgi:hypothetical protein
MKGERRSMGLARLYVSKKKILKNSETKIIKKQERNSLRRIRSEMTTHADHGKAFAPYGCWKGDKLAVFSLAKQIFGGVRGQNWTRWSVATHFAPGSDGVLFPAVFV